MAPVTPNSMNITATAVAVTLALVVGVGFLFFGPGIFAPFQPHAATTTDQTNQQLMASTSDQNQQAASGPTPTTGTPVQGPLPTTLTAKDITVGTGAEAKAGETVTVAYVGMLPNGQVFDTSSAHAETKNGFSFPLGAGQVIKGWDQGVVGMKVGGKRELIIPPDLAYGANGVGNVIPPNATLIFEVELLKVGQ